MDMSEIYHISMLQRLYTHTYHSTSYIFIYIYISHAHHIFTSSVFAQWRFSLQVGSCTNDSGRLLGSLAFAGNSHKRRHSHEGLAG